MRPLLYRHILSIFGCNCVTLSRITKSLSEFFTGQSSFDISSEASVPKSFECSNLKSMISGSQWSSKWQSGRSVLITHFPSKCSQHSSDGQGVSDLSLVSEDTCSSLILRYFQSKPPSKSPLLRRKTLNNFWCLKAAILRFLIASVLYIIYYNIIYNYIISTQFKAFKTDYVNQFRHKANLRMVWTG